MICLTLKFRSALGLRYLLKGVLERKSHELMRYDTYTDLPPLRYIKVSSVKEYQVALYENFAALLRQSREIERTKFLFHLPHDDRGFKNPIYLYSTQMNHLIDVFLPVCLYFFAYLEWLWFYSSFIFSTFIVCFSFLSWFSYSLPAFYRYLLSLT